MILDASALLIIGLCLIVLGYVQHISGRQDKEGVIGLGILLVGIYWIDRYIGPFFGLD